ncbi:MAG: hypothetical protein ABIA62_00790 [Candidatus Woesearchaeota archaeon]
MSAAHHKILKLLTQYTLVLILMLNIAYAGVIFEGEVKDNIPFTVDSITHIARYYPSAGKVSILAGEERILVAKEDCQTLNKYEYCLDSVEVGIDEDTSDPASIMQLRVFKAGPDLSVKRTVSQDEPDIDESVSMTATITNDGNERASSINYEDKFPSGVKVTGPNYNPGTNGIFWTGSLNPGSSQIVTYQIKFSDFMTYKSKAKAAYLFDGKMNNVYSNEVTFEVNKPYTIIENLSAKSVGLGEEIGYTITINNTASQELSITSLKMNVPKGVVVSKRDMGLEISGDTVSYTGTILTGASKTLSFKFKSSQPLQGTLLVNAEIRFGTQRLEEESTYKIGIGVSDIVPEITFSHDTVKGGAELEIEAKITNNGEATISGVSIDMASDILEPRGWRNLELKPGDKHYAFNKIINAPATDEEKTYFITIKGSYITGSGKTMPYNATGKVTVLAQEKLIEMSPIITPQPEVNGTKSFNVTLNIKNIAPYKLTFISLIDTFPQGFKAIVGDQYIDIEEMAIGEERVAYSYILKVPNTYTEDSFKITRTFNALDRDEEKVMTETLTKVNLKEVIDNTDTAANTNISAENAGDAVGTEGTTADDTKDKPGIFKRFWGWLTGLFSKEPEETFE